MLSIILLVWIFLIVLDRFIPTQKLPSGLPIGNKPVIFFDGICKFCDNAVNFLLKEDKKAILTFSTLQGDFAKRNLSRQELSSMVYLDEKGERRESNAFINILWRIGGLWRVISALLMLVPAFIRNAVYRLIAVNRYRLFGKKDHCMVPTIAERNRFID